MPDLVPGQVWQATRGAAKTFPRVVRMVTVCGVHYRRVLRDQSLGHAEMTSLEGFGEWINKHEARAVE